jgi:hypothetical protein
MKFSLITALGSVFLTLVSATAQQNSPSVPAPAASAPTLGMGVNGGASDPNTSNSGLEEDLQIPDERLMLTPPPVSGQAYPVSPTSEERANFLRGGVVFNAAYSDNVLGSTSATPISDVSYSIWPTVAIDQTGARLHWVLSYAPGFTFYQRVTSRNEADENLVLTLQYRLSPHVTFSLSDGLQKSSSVFNQPGDGLAGAVSGSDLSANNSVIAPIADRLSNSGNVAMTYQFTANDMVGAGGIFTNLHYPDPAQVPGLYDSATRAGSGFYSHRLSQQHYVGLTYQYQDLLSYPATSTNRTTTNAALLFYTFYPARTFSISFFGGPQYFSQGAQYISPYQPAAPGLEGWKPAGGASLNWQGLHSALAISYVHTVSGSGGLVGAVELDSASAFVRQKLTKNLSASLAGGYFNNGILSLASLGGHSFYEGLSLQRQLGEHFNAQAGYTRSHQTYDFFSANPDTNREWMSVTYQFSRPLGR